MARVIEANSKPLSYALQNEGTERRVRVTLEELMPAAQDKGVVMVCRLGGRVWGFVPL